MRGDDRHRVLIVIPSVTGGGAERMVVNLCRAIDRRRWEPVVATFAEPDESDRELLPDVELHGLGKRGRLGNLQVVLGLAAMIRRERPDLVFTRIYFTGLVAFLARMLSGVAVPLVSAVDCTLSHALEWEPFTALRRAAVRFVFPRLEHVVAVSGGVKRDLVSSFGVKPDRCTVIHNSVELDRIGRMAEEPPPEWFECGEPVVVSVGRLIEAKNFPLLLRAFRRLTEGRDARLVIVGEGPERERLERLALDLDIEDRFSLPGFVSNPFRFVARADVMALSSDWEGFGNVVVEAMACGVPVVCTRYEHGAEEIISDGENGLLVPCREEKALAEAMERVLSDEKLRARLVDGGLERCRDFDNRLVTRRYEDVFSGVLEGRQ